MWCGGKKKACPRGHAFKSKENETYARALAEEIKVLPTTTRWVPTMNSFVKHRIPSLSLARHYPKNETYFVRLEIEMRLRNLIDGNAKFTNRTLRQINVEGCAQLARS